MYEVISYINKIPSSFFSLILFSKFIPLNRPSKVVLKLQIVSTLALFLPLVRMALNVQNYLLWISDKYYLKY